MNYGPESSHVEEPTHHGEIKEASAYGKVNRTDRELIDEVLAKVGEHRGPTYREAIAFLDYGLEDKNQETYELVEQIKKDFYRSRIVLFAPLYLFNYCINRCVYCPYHVKNKHIPRKKLTRGEIHREVMTLQDMGHKRLALETGGDPVHNPIERMLESIGTTYGIRHKNGAICRASVNIVATTMENYRELKDAGIGTYILFQEIYHKESCEKPHPIEPKHDYCYHTGAMDRAQLGSVDDVGYGALFGLGLYRYEFIGLLMYMEHPKAVFGVRSHTISVPRMRRADDVDPGSFDSGIDDGTFTRLVACICIAVPYTGMTVSTRGSQKTRERMLYLDISQIGGGSKTSVGGYFELESEEECLAQLDMSDNRTLDQVTNWLAGMGYIPSFCTAYYREGCTDDRLMSSCKSGQIRNCYHPNTLITLEEYLMDYSSEETRHIGEAFIEKEIGSIPKEKVQQIIRDNLAKTEQGIRDFRF